MTYINLSRDSTWYDGIIKRITLNDFPLGRYILQVNMEDGVTSTLDGNGTQSFTFHDPTPGLRFWLERCVGDYEPFIPNRQNYLNTMRVDFLAVRVPDDVVLGSRHSVVLTGYFPDDDTDIDDASGTGIGRTEPAWKREHRWVYGMRTVYVYPETRFRSELSVVVSTNS